MKNILLIALYIASQASLAVDKFPQSEEVKAECRAIFLAFEANNINDILNFEHTENQALRESCKPYIGILNSYQYKADAFYYSCNALYDSVKRGALDAIKRFDMRAEKKEREICMRHAVKQIRTKEGDNQVRSFIYIVNQLISMNLQDQQAILNDLLAHSIVNLSIDPKYTEYLLRVGADPTVPNHRGNSILSEALWMINDWGNCNTPRFIINKMTPADFSISYKSHHSLEQAGYSTPLMEAVDMTYLCSSEQYLIANKAADLNKQDANGDTVLHYLYKAMINRGVRENDVKMLKILLTRGALLSVANAQKITPNHLRIKLKNTPQKCNALCKKL